MTRYRFVTPHRTGKWYTDLQIAQRHAYEIGAGFFDSLSGSFVRYVGTRMEVSSTPSDVEEGGIAA